MGVPFVDLAAERDCVGDAIQANLSAAIEGCAFIGGAMVSSFAEEMAAHQGCARVVTTASGTDALTLALRALGVGDGDEVVTTACTAIPTSEAITLAGARVVFADIAPGSYHVTAETLREVVTPRTRVLLPVHLYGIPCDMDAIMGLARERGLFVIEDCAQAQGACWHDCRVGTFGDAACFSFFPSKNLGGFGDGGALVARDPAVAERAWKLANHGRETKHEHVMEGMNSRLDALQAAVLRAKLPVLDERNALRRQVAGWYAELLQGCEGVVLPTVPEPAEPVWHIYPVRVADRHGLRRALQERGIQTGIHYDRALHLQPAYRYLGLGSGSLPQAESAFAEEVSLPLFPSMTRGQVEAVTAAMRSCMGTVVRPD